MNRFLAPRTIRGDKNPRVAPRPDRIERGKGRPCIRPVLIDRRAEHDRLSLEAGMADAGNNMAVDAGENHLF